MLFCLLNFSEWIYFHESFLYNGDLMLNNEKECDICRTIISSF